MTHQNPLALSLVTMIAAGAATVVIPAAQGWCVRLWQNQPPDCKAAILITSTLLALFVFARISEAVTGIENFN